MGDALKDDTKPQGVKQQSAIEFMVTYAWAILLMAVLLSLLYFFVIAPYSISPSSCSFVTQLTCKAVILGTNAMTHNTILTLLVTNSQQYPIEGPALFANINGVNTSNTICTPYFVPAGGQFLCQLTLPVKTNINSFESGYTYLNASNCGFSPTYSASSCSASRPVTYAGSFSAKAQPVFSLGGNAISVTITSNLSAQYLNEPVTLNGTVQLLGTYLQGATVNFTENSVIPVITPRYATTDGAGLAYSQIMSALPTTVVVTASVLGITSNGISITFTTAP